MHDIVTQEHNDDTASGTFKVLGFTAIQYTLFDPEQDNDGAVRMFIRTPHDSEEDAQKFYNSLVAGDFPIDHDCDVEVAPLKITKLETQYVAEIPSYTIQGQLPDIRKALLTLVEFVSQHYRTHYMEAVTH